jgi:hypothetical protein
MKIYPNNGIMDVCGYTRINSKDLLSAVSGWLPRVVWEFSLHDGNKEAQLFGYFNNLDKDYPDNYWQFCLGVTVIRTNSPTISLLGYYKIIQQIGNEEIESKMASFKLFEAPLSMESLAKVLHAIDYWMNIPNDSFLLSSIIVLPTEIQRNLCRDISQQIIYKVYDYRFIEKAVVNESDRKSYILSERYLASFQLVINLPDIQVFSYEYIEGKHYPKNSKQVLYLLLFLKKNA